MSEQTDTDLTGWKAPAHFDESLKIVRALLNEQIAAEFSAEELVEKASEFFQGLQWEASNRASLRYR